MVLPAGFAEAEAVSVAGTLPAPKGFTAFGSCVTQMETHYACKGEWPLGPILGYDQQGRLTTSTSILSARRTRHRSARTGRR